MNAQAPVPSAKTVDDVPLWEGYQFFVAPEYELRRDDEYVALVFRGCDPIMHVGVPARSFDPKLIPMMMNNLGSHRFEKEFPGQYTSAPGHPSLPHRIANAFAEGVDPAEADKLMWIRANELTGY